MKTVMAFRIMKIDFGWRSSTSLWPSDLIGYTLDAKVAARYVPKPGVKSPYRVAYVSVHVDKHGKLGIYTKPAPTWAPVPEVKK